MLQRFEHFLCFSELKTKTIEKLINFGKLFHQNLLFNLNDKL